MNTNPDHQTATIYQFPTARVRARAGRLRDETSVFESKLSQPVQEDFSGSWYHEAAIREADVNRNH